MKKLHASWWWMMGSAVLQAAGLLFYFKYDDWNLAVIACLLAMYFCYRMEKSCPDCRI